MKVDDALALVLGSFVVVRATRLVVADDVTAGARSALGRRLADPERTSPHWALVLSHCQWCVGFWLSLVVALILGAAGLLHDWRLVLLGWWAMAGAAGLMLDGRT